MIVVEMPKPGFYDSDSVDSSIHTSSTYITKTDFPINCSLSHVEVRGGNKLTSPSLFHTSTGSAHRSVHSLFGFTNRRNDWLTCIRLCWRANPLVTYPNKHGEILCHRQRDEGRQRDVNKRHFLFRELLRCEYFEKAGNSLPFSEAADSPMLTDFCFCMIIETSEFRGYSMMRMCEVQVGIKDKSAVRKGDVKSRQSVWG